MNRQQRAQQQHDQAVEKAKATWTGIGVVAGFWALVALCAGIWQVGAVIGSLLLFGLFVALATGGRGWH